MRSLSDTELLSVWERGLFQPPDRQALLLLAAACPETSLQTVAELSIGRRDAGLLTLREWTFGPNLVSVTDCPACCEPLELTFTVADIRTLPEPAAGPADSPQQTPTFSVCIASYEVSFRLPNSLDLVALSEFKESTIARRWLLERCLLEAHYQEQTCPLEQLPPEVIDAVVARMGQLDPQADIQLSLICPTCDHEWTANFDIGPFFWSEITAWAYRLLRQVHHLAVAYGWREADILALSPWKRQFYLELVNG